MAVDLLFEGAPFASQPIDLLFGGAGGVAPQAATATYNQALGAPTWAAAVVYDNRVTRWRENRTQCGMGVGQHAGHSNASAWGVGRKYLSPLAAPWQPALSQHAAVGVVFGQTIKLDFTTAAGWQQADRRGIIVQGVWQVAANRVASAVSVWQQAVAQHVSVASMLQVADRRVVGLLALWQRAVPRERSAYQLMRASYRYAQTQNAIVWQRGRYAQNGRSIWPLPTSLAPGQWVADTDLLFQCPPLSAPWVLIFGDKPCYLNPFPALLAILPSRFYMTVHNVFAQRLPDLAAIPIDNVTVSADVGSFAWRLAATGPADVFDALAPVGGLPAQVKISVDGFEWVFGVDSLQRSHEFGKRSTRISGRSMTAAVGEPYARATERLSLVATNAQQLAAAALDLSGVGLDWGLDDWLVPAGAWSHAGTPLSAVQAIAQAAGGYVQSHRSAATLLVRHPYPTLPGGVPGGPWNWGGAFAADVQLAPDAIITSSIERLGGVDINAVYASGTTQGVLALVKRAGTAGDKLGPLQTDPLITATAAASQRGLAILGAAGAKYQHAITLPLLTGGANPGVLEVGQLVEVTDTVPWRGRVRSVSVDAGQVNVRQTVTLERHLA